jgi:hypothetical protein
MKNAVFWDVTPFRRNLRLLVTANVVPSSPILIASMVEAIGPLKRRLLQKPQGVTSQKTAFFSHGRENLSLRRHVFERPDVTCNQTTIIMDHREWNQEISANFGCENSDDYEIMIF